MAWLAILAVTGAYLVWLAHQHRQRLESDCHTKQNDDESVEAELRQAFDHQKNAKYTAAQYKNFLKKPENLVSVAALITVVVYTALTQRLLDATKQSYSEVQRAFVFPTEFRTQFYLDHKIIGLQAVWKNSGTTPTNNLSIWVTGEVKSTILTSSFAFPDDPCKCRNLPAVNSLLGPGSTIVSQPMVVRVADIPNIKSGKAHLYIWGWAKYRDVFTKRSGIQHITRYCIEVSDFFGNTNTPDNTTMALVRPCDYGNCADDECADQGIP